MNLAECIVAAGSQTSGPFRVSPEQLAAQQQHLDGLAASQGSISPSLVRAADDTYTATRKFEITKVPDRAIVFIDLVFREGALLRRRLNAPQVPMEVSFINPMSAGTR